MKITEVILTVILTICCAICVTTQHVCQYMLCWKMDVQFLYDFSHTKWLPSPQLKGTRLPRKTTRTPIPPCLGVHDFHAKRLPLYPPLLLRGIWLPCEMTSIPLPPLLRGARETLKKGRKKSVFKYLTLKMTLSTIFFIICVIRASKYSSMSSDKKIGVFTFLEHYY